ncbi:hypothetical protein [Alkalicoccus luteus]|nr:hypothetical protein [Alkalicoccus luteus]
MAEETAVNETTTRVIVEKEDTNGMATAALVLGIIGLVIGIVPFIGWFVMPLWILAVVFGIIGMQKEIKKGMALTGVILGGITILYKIGFWVLMIIGSAA